MQRPRVVLLWAANGSPLQKRALHLYVKNTNRSSTSAPWSTALSVGNALTSRRLDFLRRRRVQRAAFRQRGVFSFQTRVWLGAGLIAIASKLQRQIDIGLSASSRDKHMRVRSYIRIRHHGDPYQRGAGRNRF